MYNTPISNAAARKAEPMTFIDALNNEELRNRIDAIEDLAGSLDGREDCPVLRPMYDREVAAFEADTGLNIGTL